jgi:hypothetical protein
MSNSILQTPLPEVITRPLFSKASDSQRAAVYFDTNCLSSLLFSDLDAAPWMGFQALMGGVCIEDSLFDIILSVPQISELLGLRVPNVTSTWTRPNGDSDDCYKAAWAHCQRIAMNSLNGDDIRLRFIEFWHKIKNDSFKAPIARLMISEPESNDFIRTKEFISTLASHWAFESVQISELYGDELFEQIIPKILHRCLVERAEGVDLSIYRASQKHMRMALRRDKKGVQQPEVKEAFISMERNLPEFKDRGDSVDGELLHYAIAGGFAAGQRRVVAFTFDPDEAKMLKRLQVARRHYEDLIGIAKRSHPELAGALKPGWVVMLYRDFSIRRLIDADRDTRSFSALLSSQDREIA